MFGRSKAAPRSQELVFLDPDDDLGTIRSKLESSTAEEIYLVIPRKSPVLRSPLDFRILARIANELSSETILVSGDAGRRHLAENEGFRTKRGLRTLKHLMIGPDQKPPRLVMPDWAPSLPGIIALTGGIALAALAFMLIYPTMKVTLVPQTTEVARDLNITVDPTVQNADVTAGVLPGETLTQTRQEISDKVDIPPDRVVGREKARGEVIITSQRPDQQVMQRGTRVMVAGGPKFVLDQEVRVPPRVPTRVGVTAVDAGTAGNVPAGSITVFDGFDASGLEVTNQRATAGGSDRQAKVITQEDFDKLKASLQSKARAQAVQQMKVRAGEDRSMIEQSVQVKEDPVTFDQQVGQEADQLTGRMAYTATAIAFNNLRFNDLVSRMLAQSAGNDQRLSGSAKIDPPGVLGVQNQQVKLRTRASGVAMPNIDSSTLTNALRWKSPREAQTLVNRLQGLAQPAAIQVNPAWAPIVYRVEVAVQGPK